MKNTFFILLLFFSHFCNAQTKNFFGRTYTDTLPERYKTSISTFRKTILSIIPSYYKNEKYYRMTYRFSDQQAFGISELISSGEVYSDWMELENYVNSIMQKIMPEELKGDSVIHAYLVKDGDFNAFMTPAGQMFINIGVFAYICDEATLAAIIAHELAHYYKYHSYQSFFKSETKWKRILILHESSKRNFSINHEFEADSLAMLWINRSYYNISGVLKAFQIMKRREQKMIMKDKQKWKLEDSDHPITEERLLKLNEYIKQNKNTEGEYFLVDREKFFLFQEEAKPEILKNLMNAFLYGACVETAFKFHLLDPDNKIYVYYLMESIRRMCYLDNELWIKNFITNSYHYPRNDEFQRQKIKIDAGLFDKFNIEIMGMSPQETSRIKARFYWEDKPEKFKTYEQAYDFFSRLADVLGCNECILSNALSHTKSKVIRDSLLQAYLSKEEIQYASFARELLKKSVAYNLPNKKLLVFNDFTATISQGQDRIPIRVEGEYGKKDICLLFDSVVSKLPDRESIFLPALKYNGLNDYRMFRELLQFSLIATVSKGTKAELYILDPKYLDFFYRFNVNEIEFLHCMYGEYRNSEKSVEAWEDISNLTYPEIFSRTKSTRFLEVIILSVRVIEKGAMKIRYYGGDNELNFKEEGFGQIVVEIRKQVRKKDEYAKKFDIGYYNSNFIILR